MMGQRFFFAPAVAAAFFLAGAFFAAGALAVFFELEDFAMDFDLVGVAITRAYRGSPRACAIAICVFRTGSAQFFCGGDGRNEVRWTPLRVTRIQLQSGVHDGKCGRGAAAAAIFSRGRRCRRRKRRDGRGAWARLWSCPAWSAVPSRNSARRRGARRRR